MQETWKPTVGGVLAVIGGAIEVISGMVIAAVGSLGWFFGLRWFSALGAPLIILGIIAIMGGVYALKRRVWGLALAGSICAVFGPWGLLGILAIIFVSLGKDEFK